MADVASAAGQSISDILVQIKKKVVAATDVSLDTASRNALNEDFQSLKNQITSIVQNASFNGTNLLDGSITPGIQVLADADAKHKLTIASENLTLSGSIITLTNASTHHDGRRAPRRRLTQIATSLQNVNSALARLGSAQKKVEAHATFVSKLINSLNSGIGNLVDADLAQTSAQLQALQVKQQLGVQAIAIANSRPQILLTLFR